MLLITIDFIDYISDHRLSYWLC